MSSVGSAPEEGSPLPPPTTAVTAARKRPRAGGLGKQQQHQQHIPSNRRQNGSSTASGRSHNYHGNSSNGLIISRPVVIVGLGIIVIVATWTTVQFVFWIQDQAQHRPGSLTVNDRSSSSIDVGGQVLRRRQQSPTSSKAMTLSSSQKQLVETPAFNSDFGRNNMKKTDKQVKKMTTTIASKTTTTAAFDKGMTWDTLSFPKIPPVYKPTKEHTNRKYVGNDDGDDTVPPINGLLYEQSPDLMALPKWIRDYVVWHAKTRQQFPGMDLFTNPDAPPLLVRTCLGICGGLHDRIGQLPWDLYLAAKTKRILLIAWQRPKALEYFLQPAIMSSSSSAAASSSSSAEYNGITLDWTVPGAAKFGFDDIKVVRSNVTEMFAGYDDSHPESSFFNNDLDAAIERATSGHFSNIKILRHRLLGHLYQDVLEERLHREGWYKDDFSSKPWDIHQSPTFGRIFHLFFRPSKAVHELIVNTMAELGLLTFSQDDGQTKYEVAPFHAVHCRVRHPKAHAKGNVVKGKNERYPADKTGLPWEPGSSTRQFAVDTAQSALQCAHDIIQHEEHSTGRIYFLADSNDLVRHVSSELHSQAYLSVNASQVSPRLLETIKDLDTIGSTPVARNVEMETAHIDRQKGRDPPAYYATLVDLYIAMHAECVVYGIGYYAAFAAKISGTSCQFLYAIEEWGAQTDKRKKAGEVHAESNGGGAHLCPNVATNK